MSIQSEILKDLKIKDRVNEDQGIKEKLEVFTAVLCRKAGSLAQRNALLRIYDQNKEKVIDKKFRDGIGKAIEKVKKDVGI